VVKVKLEGGKNMWKRSNLKNKAKEKLKGNYWKSFLVSLVILITGGSHNHGEIGSSTGSAGTEVGSNSFFDFEIALIVGFVILLIILFRILLGYVLEVGGRKYFINLAEGKSQISDLAYGFKNNNYFNIFFTMLLKSIYIILWSFLFIIPGIIKMYEYRMVPYILAENPGIGHKKAIKFSSQMTQGEKWNIFILDLSFLGWFILGSLFFGIGLFFVQPYYDAVNAELYLKLKKED